MFQANQVFERTRTFPLAVSFAIDCAPAVVTLNDNNISHYNINQAIKHQPVVNYINI